ncbi:hypothetical protein [Actinomadura atramentaria]|uniref:hypothetical protein n=1 Tax=Actinomadura atramentaria TaxID=1990 RepID=UPI00036B42B2|nr:hypothetical protein [Actinomadura atramentaria]
MRAARLAAAGAAAGLAVLGTAGAALAAAPTPTISVTPNPFTPGAKLTVKVTECIKAPTGDATSIFASDLAFTGTAGGTWTAVGATKSSLQPGHTYTAVLTCEVEGGTGKLTLTVNPAKPKPTEPAPPKFSFGYDDVTLSTRKVVSGGKIGLTVRCPSAVTVTGNGFTSPSLPVKTVKTGVYSAAGTFRSGKLPDPTTMKVACKGYGYVTYSTKPGQPIKHGKKSPTVPVGAPQTGDGSLYGQPADGSATPWLAGGGAVAAAGVLGGGLVLLRRRSAGREQA